MSEQSFGQIIKEGQRDIDVSGSMFRTRIFLMSELIDMLDSGKLKLVGDRPFKYWSKSLKCRVVENLLVGLPPGGVVVDASDSTWYVVEGGEMLDVFRQFFNNRLPLDDVNFNSEIYAGKTFSGDNRLSLMMQRRLTNAQIVTTVADAKSSYVARLWLYDSVLSRNRISSRLWDAVAVVMPDKYRELKKLATANKINDLRIFWDVLFAASFFYMLSHKTNDDFESKVAVRFIMFEYICLDQINTIWNISSEYFSSNEDFLCRLVNKIKAEIPIEFAEKKRICYVMVQTLVAVHLRKIPADSFGKHFEQAWKINESIGRGALDRDYIRKIKALYNTMIKE